MELVQSQVIFDKASHTYTLNGKALKGITSTLVRRAYPHTYDKPDHLTEEEWQTVLSRAAERGTAVHETLEAYEKTGAVSDIPELTNWLSFKETHGLTVAASEYLVSDNEFYATAIDHVLEDTMGCAVLVDIKTTNTLHVPEVTLQLNICKRLFEQQNPDIDVLDMYAVWLRGEACKFVRVGYIADEVLDALLEADMEDRPFDSMVLFGDLPVYFGRVEDEVAELQRQMKVAKERYDTLQYGLLKLMSENGVKTFTGSKVKLTRKLATTRRKFDEKRFASEHADLYSQYITETPVKESILITVKS